MAAPAVQHQVIITVKVACACSAVFFGLTQRASGPCVRSLLSLTLV